MVTANSPLHNVGQFFRSVCTDNAEVGGMAFLGNGQDWNEKHGVGSRDLSSTLCQVVNLNGIGLLPIDAIRTGAEFFVFSKFTGIGIKGIAMTGSVTHRITRWVLVGMQGMEAGEWQGQHWL